MAAGIDLVQGILQASKTPENSTKLSQLSKKVEAIDSDLDTAVDLFRTYVRDYGPIIGGGVQMARRLKEHAEQVLHGSSLSKKDKEQITDLVDSGMCDGGGSLRGMADSIAWLDRHILVKCRTKTCVSGLQFMRDLLESRRADMMEVNDRKQSRPSIAELGLINDDGGGQKMDTLTMKAPDKTT